MSWDNHKNFATSLVAVAPSPATSGTALTVTTGEGSLFPVGTFNAVIWPAPPAQPLASNAEIVRCSSRTGDVLTITRTQEGSSVRTIIIGDQIALPISAKLFTDLETTIDSLNTSALIDGGAPSTNHSGNLKVDFGSPT